MGNDDLSLLVAERRRTGVPEHVPATNAHHIVMHVLQRILVERVRDLDYGESAAALDVVRPRVLSVLRQEFLAERGLTRAFLERTRLDAYVAALMAKMNGLQPSDSFGETRDTATGARPARIDDRNFASAELVERVALLFYAEQALAGAGTVTAGFWDLVCEELAVAVRAAFEREGRAPRADVPSLVRQPGGCTSYGAEREVPVATRERADGNASGEVPRG